MKIYAHFNFTNNKKHLYKPSFFQEKCLFTSHISKLLSVLNIISRGKETIFFYFTRQQSRNLITCKLKFSFGIFLWTELIYLILGLLIFSRPSTSLMPFMLYILMDLATFPINAAKIIKGSNRYLSSEKIIWCMKNSLLISHSFYVFIL